MGQATSLSYHQPLGVSRSLCGHVEESCRVDEVPVFPLSEGGTVPPCLQGIRVLVPRDQ